MQQWTTKRNLSQIASGRFRESRVSQASATFVRRTSRQTLSTVTVLLTHNKLSRTSDLVDFSFCT
ncbi:hypothetical protein BIW11_08247 [Tropilaelaps mercedesae]|uniref:Uncharacterized protein n=1 Tax=Tropilaelaps mercedesae TaxID=418985 RepID=A0A1V9XQD6_9ACAR|nr:hypothetical protein BIW11_08247 [Tropilaelaps mercedesae]